MKLSANKFIKTLLVGSMALFAVVSCQDKNVPTPKPVEKIQLVAETNGQTVATINFGKQLPLTVKIFDPENKGLKAQEPLSIKLAITGTAKKADGTTEALEANKIFSNAEALKTIKIEQGQSFVTVNLETLPQTNYKSINGTISLTTRSAVFKSGKTITYDLVDKFPITLKVSGQLVSKEPISVDTGKPFTLTVETAQPVDADLTVSVTAPATEGLTFTTAPATLTIAKGQSTFTTEGITPAITNKTASVNATWTLASQNADYECIPATMTLNVVDPSMTLSEANKLTNERHVYINSDQIFMSTQNKAEVEAWGKSGQDLKEMHQGDAHPNAELAAKGWKLYNAMEFTPIDALTAKRKVNEYGNREPGFTGAQNVAGVQKYQGIYNNRWTNMNDAGHLVIWSSKGDNVFMNTYNSTGEKKDFGAGALFMNKFRDGNGKQYTWGANNVLILPNMRIEVRLRTLGNLYGFNPAVWLQGNQEAHLQWPLYGEVDILEAPCGSKAGQGYGVPYQTFHFGDPGDKEKSIAKNQHDVTSNGLKEVKMNEFNIFWVEWRSNDEIAMGINGKETVVITKNQYTNESYASASDKRKAAAAWPYTDELNTEGMHLLITFPCASNWAFGKDNSAQPNSDWNMYLNQIPYASSKTDPNTPRMEIDYIRFYTKDGYGYKGNPQRKDRNIPMY